MSTLPNKDDLIGGIPDNEEPFFGPDDEPFMPDNSQTPAQGE